MAAARYWRIVSLDSYDGSSLQMSEFGLFDGATRRDTGAVITSTVAPAAGSLSALNDGGFGTSVTFNAAQFRLPGFAIEWDLGSSLEVNVVRLATVSNATAPMVFTIQYQDAAGQWVTGHQVRGAKLSLGALGETIPVEADGFFQNVPLLLHMDGLNGSTSFPDSSLSNRTVTAAGNAQVSTAQSRFGGSSLLLDGSGDWLEIADSPDMELEMQDFTIEFWMRSTAVPARQGLFTKGRSSGFPPIDIQTVSSGFFIGVSEGASWNVDMSLSGTLWSLNTWHHIALTRFGSVFTFFRDGQVLGTRTASFSVRNTTEPWRIGFSTVFNVSFNGNIDEFRLTRGLARYTTSFTPPSTPFLDTPSPGSGDPLPLRTSPTASPRSISYYRVPDPTTFSTRAPLSFDQEDAGRFRIVGTVKEVAVPSNAPLRRRVLLIDEVSRRTIRETWSDAATGVYVFNQIAGAPRRYTVVSYDHTGQYRAVIADNLEAEPMT